MDGEIPTTQFEPALYAALQEAARRHHLSVNRLVEMYCAQGLARESGSSLEGQSVPELRGLLEEVVEHSVERRLDAMVDRLARLTLRSIRHAALAHRFLYHSIARTDQASADAIEALAARDTAWLLATNLGDEPPT